MTHFPRQFATASPVLMVSSQPYYQTQLPAGTFGRYHSIHMNHKITTETPMLPSPVRGTGRKRSLDEASINLEPDPNSTLAVDSLEDWANEVGMALIRSGNSHVTGASNQTDSLMHLGSNVKQRAKQDVQIDRPELRIHKSQRLDRTTQKTPCSILHQPASKSSLGDISSTISHDALAIDNFTLHLGIGWRRISGDEHIQAAARGWARFIENNFGLARVRICLESKGLQSYLIEASNGYFLFAENLRQGRLVSPTAEGALKNLQSLPPVFEGPELAFLAPRGDELVDSFVDAAMVLDS
ncbi:hypothetical protein E4U42_000428 [Claviceps africana]|uniref:Uncharacterized protein n=1 Tax=Claviceps africana TaxID=83212 RepID=A0A8K0JEH3_9HYPO|nr:hypothetical protein E4U42_000428 [Claviceps africana]